MMAPPRSPGGLGRVRTAARRGHRVEKLAREAGKGYRLCS
ncbi:hypothetical protein EV190_10954 [Actinorugispora endophytica]|uniref:Uncharacterized protein n=1 Tax=Actinorugispora endophytica TaxID=1605990 RepID=A0A4R6UX48_9ACTN|nr:hypothetical protein EV190_10954 [Actinorugispora endophytica]